MECEVAVMRDENNKGARLRWLECAYFKPDFNRVFLKVVSGRHGGLPGTVNERIAALPTPPEVGEELKKHSPQTRLILPQYGRWIAL